MKLKTPIQVHGHRGARATRFENTLSAFQYALDVGVDFLEMDLMVTKDNELVVSHEALLEKGHFLNKKGAMLEKDLKIRSLSLKQVKSYEFACIQNPKFKKQKLSQGTHIPLFREVLSLLNEHNKKYSKQVGINVETKICPYNPNLTPEPKEFVELILNDLRTYNVIDKTILQSFDFRSLGIMKALEPRIKTSQLISDNYIDPSAYWNMKKNIDIISPYYKWITKDLVVLLKKIGFEVVPWTPNNKKDWSFIIDMGVDAIITDDPKGLLNYLNQD